MTWRNVGMSPQTLYMVGGLLASGGPPPLPSLAQSPAFSTYSLGCTFKLIIISLSLSLFKVFFFVCLFMSSPPNLGLELTTPTPRVAWLLRLSQPGGLHSLFICIFRSPSKVCTLSLWLHRLASWVGKAMGSTSQKNWPG